MSGRGVNDDGSKMSDLEITHFFQNVCSYEEEFEEGLTPEEVAALDRLPVLARKFNQGTDKVYCPDHTWITDRETPEETKEREETWLVREETRRMLG